MRRQASPRKADSGFALILALVVVAVAAGAVGLMVASSASTRASGSSVLASSTVECAHGGTSRGKVELIRQVGAGSNLSGVIATSAANGGIVNDTLNLGTVNVTFFDNDDGDSDPSTDVDGRTMMRSRCRIADSESVIEVAGRGTGASAFTGTSCGCSAIQFNGAAVSTDSYDSIVGPYGGSNIGSRGNIQGNGSISISGTVGGDVIGTGDIGGNGTVTGDARSGGTVTGLTVLGTTFQNMNPPPAPCRCNGGIDVAAMTAQAAASNDNGSVATLLGCPHINLVNNSMTLNGGATCSLSSGTYYFESLRINGNGRIIIDPTLDPEDPDDNVFIFLDGGGPFRFNGNGITNSSDLALNLEIYSNSTADVDLRGGAEFSGILYAPFGTADIGGNMDYNGGLFADVIRNSGSAALHFDENLLEREDFIAGWRRRAGTWRIVN